VHNITPKVNSHNGPNIVIKDIVLDISSIVNSVFHIILA